MNNEDSTGRFRFFVKPLNTFCSDFKPHEGFFMRGMIVSFALLWALIEPLAAQTEPILIARTGTAAPAGGNFLSLNAPVISSTGQVAFRAIVGGPGLPDLGGIFSNTTGSLSTVALDGQPTPIPGSTYSQIDSTFARIVLHGDNRIAFGTRISLVGSNSAIFEGPANALSTVEQGFNSGAGNVGSFSLNVSPMVSSSGAIAYYAGVLPSSGTAQRQFLFSNNNGNRSVIADFGTTGSLGTLVAGNRAVGVTPRMVYGINGNGRVAFESDVRSSVTGFGLGQGLFLGTPGNLEIVAMNTEMSPAGLTYSSFTSMAQGNQAYAFRAELDDGFETRTAIFTNSTGPSSTGPLQTLAIVGGPAPGGGTFSHLNFLRMNGSGTVLYSGTVNNQSGSSLFLGTIGNLTPVVLHGMPAPDFGTFTGIENCTINNNGMVIFQARLAGPGVNSNNDRGLYGWTAEGGFAKILREGDLIDIDPGPNLDLRAVTSIFFDSTPFGEDGRSPAFNDNGQITLSVTLSGAGTAIITTAFVPIPEPQSLPLLTTALAAAACWFRGLRGKMLAVSN